MTNLRKIREKKGVSQSAVAKELGISRQAYNNYELGKREADYETLLKLAEYFETTVEDLIKETDVRPDRNAQFKVVADKVLADPNSAYKMGDRIVIGIDDEKNKELTEKILRRLEKMSDTDKEIQNKLSDLNDTGKVKALDYISDLWEQEKYVTKKG
ncbi:MAG: helix-turn-helix domain-containing protein [Ruminococcus sp.]|nr:helix-turn-helix domain-containing protein [Ruminococcus sp.]